MFGGLLDKDVFLTFVCQKHTQGREVDAKWVATLMGVTKKTALKHLKEMEMKGELIKREVRWRSNSKKFVYAPSERTIKRYKAREFRPSYTVYMHALFNA